MRLKQKVEGVLVEELQAQADRIAEQGRELAEQAEQLATQLRAARGTQNLTPTVLPRDKRTVVRHPIDETLYANARKLLESKPMSLREFVETLKISDNQAKVLITKMQREGVGVVNLGQKNKALWYIPDERTLKRLRGNPTDE